MTDKTDRELLELTAKAAGYEVWQGRGHQEDMLFMRLKKPDPTGKCCGREWNPLEDDGDALRLAVQLGFSVEPGRCWHSHYGPAFGEDVLGGVMVATRRAIVRAAAQIGAQM